jgi:hypothetical protein
MDLAADHLVVLPLCRRCLSRCAQHSAATALPSMRLMLVAWQRICG